MYLEDLGYGEVGGLEREVPCEWGLDGSREKWGRIAGETDWDIVLDP
jgi:hypothetical protein